MAKLHRLMSPDLPRIIDPGKLADCGEHLVGRVPLRELERIHDLILDHDGDLGIRLEFSRNDKGQVIITGELSAQLTVVCQRCLNPMPLKIQNRINVGVVEDRQQITELPDVFEPILAEDHKLLLLRLIEEELLLAMPLSPAHAQSVCPGTSLVSEHAAKKESPFAVLKGLKTGKQ